MLEAVIRVKANRSSLYAAGRGARGVVGSTKLHDSGWLVVDICRHQVPRHGLRLRYRKYAPRKL
jgi:hypothetical protein